VIVTSAELHDANTGRFGPTEPTGAFVTNASWQRQAVTR
jgi:hypothetical protein